MLGACPAVPRSQSPAEETGQPTRVEEANPEARESAGCVSCHKGIEPSHARPEEALATCVGCHGGNGAATTKASGHVRPRFPERWANGSIVSRQSSVANRQSAIRNPQSAIGSGNPEQSYTLLNQESPEFIRFVNPGDLRVAHLSCGQDGSCHADTVLKVRKSMMTTGGMLYGAALYNNGAFPLKNHRFGESYGPEGVAQRVMNVPPPTAEEIVWRGIMPFLDPLPRWEITQVGNVLRAFERGGLKKGEVGNPNREEEPGRPDAKLSFRGHGTLLRTDPVFLGLQKTRLFDPTHNFLGTNDQPGDYHSSGCSGCHSVYANSMAEEFAGPYAEFGRWGESASKDEALAKARARRERGHPITHTMTQGVPSGQCMACHIHPGGNMLTPYFGMTWWDNETDGEAMYPRRPLKLSAAEKDRVQRRNPEGAALKGNWSDLDFLAKAGTEEFNRQLKRTQFGDFHSRGWILRKVYKQDRKGNLLDAEGQPVAHEDPERWAKAVHLQDIHLERGMACVDCHFTRDVHGDGRLYQEARAAIEIDCVDCHGTIRKKADPTSPDAVSSGPAGGNRLSELKVKVGKNAPQPRFFLKEGRPYMRSALHAELDWELPQVLDTITPGHPRYRERSRLAKTIRRDNKTWGTVPVEPGDLAHATENMACYTCHTSWTSSCFGCHLSMSANQKKPQLHNEGGPSRNWTSYNFQTLRDDAFMLGRDGTATAGTARQAKLKQDPKLSGGRVTPVRSSCAVLVSSQNQNREWIYQQQQTVSAEGFAGTAFSTFVPHTVRGRGETKFCSDCHVSDRNNNNAWLANVLLHGTNFYNFLGRYCYVATGKGFEAVVVTERDEPQAVIGSPLHRLAYPDMFARHLKRDRQLERAVEHHGKTIALQQRGEYLYAAEGGRGLVVYDIANVDNKGFSERAVTAPVSPLGQRFYVRTKYATAVAAPSTMAIDPLRTRRPENQEGTVHPFYGYLYVTDRHEGLILVPAGTLLDGSPTNNFLTRALTWNPDGVLDGAGSITFAGTFAYITCKKGLVVVDLSEPLKPKVAATIGAPALKEPRSVAIQLRYAFVCDAEGLKVLDIGKEGNFDNPKPLEGVGIPLSEANDVYVARTYAYVAAGRQGLAIVDIERPNEPRLDQRFDAGGSLDDARMVRTGMTNNSLYAYVADGRNGLRVVQLLSPETEPAIYGFSPRPNPVLIATYHTSGPALAVSEGLDRDRAVDESGNQLAVFGRRGARPLNADEQLYHTLTEVTDNPPSPPEGPRLSQGGPGWGDWLLIFPLLGLGLRRRRPAVRCRVAPPAPDL